MENFRFFKIPKKLIIRDCLTPRKVYEKPKLKEKMHQFEKNKPKFENVI